MMNLMEQDILQALRELEAAVKRLTAAAPKPDLRPLLARLDELTKQLPADADPELRHFMNRKSYEKARARLEGRGVARGSCGH